MRWLALLALVALALPAAVPAAFPGTNGRLLFTQERQSFHRNVPPNASLCVTTPAGVRPTKVASAQLGQTIEHPAVTAAGDAIAFSRAGTIFVADPDGAGRGGVAFGTSPAWSPDGTRIFFAAEGDVRSVRRDGSDPRSVTTGAALRPSAGCVARRQNARVRARPRGS